jgi:hypothetical protein
MLLHASMIGPVTLFGLVSALLQPGSGHPAYRVRYRLFRLSGVGRVRSALWLLR